MMLHGVRYKETDTYNTFTMTKVDVVPAQSGSKQD